jgi:very-short-patch-repair endonuclease
MRAEQKVVALASRQHSVVARRQALSLGMTKREIDYRIETGRLLVVERGLYLVPGSPQTWGRTAMSAVLATGPLAVASHFAAGWLLGLVEKRPPIIDVTVPHGRRNKSGRGRRVHQAKGLRPMDLTIVDRIPTTTRPRTLVDLAGVLTHERLEAAVDHALLDGRVDIDVLAAYVAGRQSKGVADLRSVIGDRRNGVPESELERVFERIMKKAKLPMPVRQQSTMRFRVDYAYADLRIAIELDGFAGHGSREAFREDRRRQNALVNAGWTVLRFTWEDMKQRPDYVVATIAEALSLARALIRVP